MSLVYEERSSDSPFIETVTRGFTVCDGSTVRPAESHWHMVFVKHSGIQQLLVVGPLTASGIASWGKDAEILWVKFKLGTFMPHLPTRRFVNAEIALPGATSQSFWLRGSAWQIPDFENVEPFVKRLAHDGILVTDPVIPAVLQGHSPDLAARTLRHRFLSATGMSRTQIWQYERAQRAAEMLQNGKLILDTVDELGYFDQAHLTRALKRWVGHTPAEMRPGRQNK